MLVEDEADAHGPSGQRQGKKMSGGLQAWRTSKRCRRQARTVNQVVATKE